MTALSTLSTAPATAGITPDQSDPVAGEVTRIAGLTGVGGVGFSGDGGPATDARLNDSLEIGAAPDGTIYLADRGNGRLRAIDPEGTITTTVRAMRSPEDDVDLDVDGWIYSPSNRPFSVAVGSDGAVVVGAKTDVTRITPGEKQEVLAGGAEGGLPAPGETAPGESTSLHRASDVAVSADGTVYAYVADIGQIIAIDPEGDVRLLAGGGESDRDNADGSQPATDYAIGRPSALAVASTGPYEGTVFFSAEQHSRVMAITPDGKLDVFAGTGESGFSGDGESAGNAQLSEAVEGLAVTPDGDVLIGDTYNAAIRQVDGDGVITTLRGAVGQVSSLDVLPDGDVVFTRGALALRLTVEGPPAMEVTELAETGADPFADAEAGEVLELGGAAQESPAQPSPALSQRSQPHRNPVAVAADGSVISGDSAAGTVRRVESDGGTSVIVGVSQPPGTEAPADTAAATDAAATTGVEEPSDSEAPTDAETPTDTEAPATEAPDTVAANERVLNGVQDLATTADGHLLIAEQHHIWELSEDETTLTRVFSSATSDDTAPVIRGITTDAEGTVYATVGDLVLRIAPDGTTETIAGGGQRWAAEVDGHPATEATLWEPTDVAVDSKRNVYLTESGRPHVRRIAPDGTVTTVLGDSYRGQDEGGFAGDGGPGTDAEMNTPLGLVIADDGALFVADSFNARVRRLDPDGTVTTVAGNGLVPAEQDTDEQDTDTGNSDTGNSDGPALETALGEPTSLALEDDGSLLISTSRPDRLVRLTGDGGLRVVAEPAADSEDNKPLAADAVLQGIQDLAVGPDDVPHLGGPDGITTLADTAIHVGGPVASRVTSGALMAVAGPNTVSRVLPDGRTVLVAGGGAVTQPDSPIPALSLNLADGLTDIAADPEGSLFILARANAQTPPAQGQSLYEVTADGLATPIPLGGVAGLVSIAAGPDGVVYGIDGASGEILRIDEQGAGAIVVAPDEESTEELVDEPFGTATALPAGKPQDLAVGVHGNLFVSVSDGVLVVNPEEDTYSFHDNVWSGGQHTLRVAADRHGNAFLLSHHEGGQAARVSALAHPAEVTAPTQIPWSDVGVIGGGAAALLGAVLVWRKKTERESS